MGDLILSCREGNNDALFADVLKLHVPEGATVADVTFGNGAFWKQAPSGRYRLLASDLLTGTDFRNLPYADASVDALVLDPPYIYNPKDTVKRSISQPYNVNGTALGLVSVNAVIDLYAEGMAEARRVLVPRGVLILKCQDQIQSGKQRWVHIELKEKAEAIGYQAVDLFVLRQKVIPTRRWAQQKHARKNHSYFWVFRRKP